MNSLHKVVVEDVEIGGDYDFDLPYQTGQPQVTTQALKDGFAALKAKRNINILVVRLLALMFLSFGSAFSQVPAEFEVASVKVAIPPADGRWSVGMRFDPGHFVAEYSTLKEIIVAVYPVPPGAKIAGPDWIEKDRYSIDAKAATSATPKELRGMVQRLLESRFRLKLRTEERTGSVFVLIISSKGLKLLPVKFDGEDPTRGAIRYTKTGLEFQHTSLKFLASYLGWLLGRPVSDESGDTALYDFTLTYAGRGGTPLLDIPESDPAFGQPTIFNAVESLGLKLETRQGKLTTYVVESAQRLPVEN